ncbi:MAG: hypothetical protein LBH21_01060, partial [Gracilibacteraceae bacterium]|nr:hypothetical protein [Gracilibacteraceae bacterium]
MFSSISGTSNSASGASSVSKGFGGLASGLDTDELVTQLTSGTTNRIDKQLQERQKALWKQEIYRDITTTLQEFSNKYFSTASSLNIMSARFFEQYTLRSSSDKVTLSGDLAMANNVKIKSIDQLADKAKASFALTKEITSKIDDSKLTNGGLDGAKIELYLDGVYKTLELHTSGVNSNNTDKILADFNDQLKDAFGTFGPAGAATQAVEAEVTGSAGNWTLTVKVADPTATFAVHAADSGVLGSGGLFEDLAPNIMNKHSLNSGLNSFGISDGDTMEINGVTITAEADDTLGSLIRKVNSSGAGGTMSYSQTTGQITLGS